jgi:hypothetical protein
MVRNYQEELSTLVKLDLVKNDQEILSVAEMVVVTAQAVIATEDTKF